MNCYPEDVPTIMNLYEAARHFQIAKQVVVWPYFSKDFLLNEIAQSRQFKIVFENQIVCNWAITFSDKEIWGDQDKSDSIFIHRICIDSNFRGNRYIDMIVQWAKKYAFKHNKIFVRLDTLGNNTGLIKHYTSAGFTFLGMYRLAYTATLPKHYQDEPNCCLFEIRI